MRIDLEGRRVLVTGSTSGIGFATARAFHAAGASVVITGRSGASVGAALRRLVDLDLVEGPGRSTPVEGFVGDLGDPATIARLASEHPSFDVVVNNVGTYEPRDVLDIADDDWDRLLQLNLLSGARIAKAHLPGMMRRGWGRMIFVSSESAVSTPVDMVHYGVTKTAQLALSRGLAKRAAGTGVTVNAVLPGPTATEGVEAMLRRAADDDAADLDQLGRAFIAQHRSSSLLGRLATPDEVAAMIVYVGSDQASATTGAALRVDGGIVDALV